MRLRIFRIITLSLLLCFCVCTIAFAWYTNAVGFRNISISSANVASTLTVYNGYDWDNDGILDDMEIPFDTENPIYDSTKAQENKYVDLIFENVMPTKVYSWKLDLSNQGDVDGFIEYKINNSLLSLDWIKTFKFTITKFNTRETLDIVTGEVIKNIDYTTLTQKIIYLGNIIKNPDASQTIFYGINEEGINTDPVYCQSNAQNDDNKFSSISYILQAEMVPYEELIENRIILPYSFYQGLQGKTFTTIDESSKDNNYFFEIVLSSK